MDRFALESEDALILTPPVCTFIGFDSKRPDKAHGKAMGTRTAEALLDN